VPVLAVEEVKGKGYCCQLRRSSGAEDAAGRIAAGCAG
jgi:hypothetical protein